MSGNPLFGFICNGHKGFKVKRMIAIATAPFLKIEDEAAIARAAR
jgi:hypothetical protein